ncbi:MAG TPA: DUF488 domain-containing protein [Candidatus Hydrogenedentes bacterium]|nr:DUF488 domain-containing protein [Candidatus Hydrogenedentota bacterium]
MNTLYTIGHSNHAMERFCALLEMHKVACVADVRSSPYSQWVPHFSKAPLEKTLNAAGFQYVFLGRHLGARREEESCYIDGQAQYANIAKLPLFREGLDRVLAESQRHNLALLCSEADPVTCHRAILICRELLRLNPALPISHILNDGTVETHDAALQRLITAHNLNPELFGQLNTPEGIVERAYDLQSERIAFRKAPLKT